uniref:SFRICE_004770 n=1 Tax=Spodoptera frugiperda TaxID=7108 RepID=A0A2H1VT10_SPOFR
MHGMCMYMTASLTESLQERLLGKGLRVRFPGWIFSHGVWKCARYMAIGSPPITWDLQNKLGENHPMTSPALRETGGNDCLVRRVVAIVTAGQEVSGSISTWAKYYRVFLVFRKFLSGSAESGIVPILCAVKCISAYPFGDKKA